jgi:hypothetical protein
MYSSRSVNCLRHRQILSKGNCATPQRSTNTFFQNFQQKLPVVSHRSAFYQFRYLSSAAANMSKDVAFAAAGATKKTTSDSSNIFIDNIGTIFLSAIGLIVASLVRSSYGTSNKNKVRDAIEEEAAIDPLEMDDLRIANSELNLSVFSKVSNDLFDVFPDGQATYHDLVYQVRQSLQHQVDANDKLGMVGTIEFGHILDRVTLGALRKHQQSTDEPQPLLFWLTALSLALNAPVPDRIQMLFKIAQQQHEVVTIDEVRRMVGYLQDTCQLVPEAQIIATDKKYPTQQYRCGTPHEIVSWEGATDEAVDVDGFAAILRSKSVCAWGECYHKKKFV